MMKLVVKYKFSLGRLPGGGVTPLCGVYLPLDRVLFSGLSVLNRILTCPGMNRSGFEILCCTPIPLPLGEDICLHGCVRYRCINRLSAKTPKNCVHFSPPLKGTLS